MRALYQTILHPWLVTYIQDETKIKPPAVQPFAYQVTIVIQIYAWFDWFMYMNILLSQIDMVIVEIVADLMMSIITTRYYLNRNQNYITI
jgi:hypothetical protein